MNLMGHTQLGSSSLLPASILLVFLNLPPPCHVNPWTPAKTAALTSVKPTKLWRSKKTKRTGTVRLALVLITDHLCPNTGRTRFYSILDAYIYTDMDKLVLLATWARILLRSYGGLY
jgi:hypothetical protein